MQVIFRQLPKVVVGDNNYGARLVFANDKTLFVTLGERETDDPDCTDRRPRTEPGHAPGQGGSYQS